ncbi:hypothetical protein I6H58_00790 [Rothia kristinae]|uniref:DUF6318 domain-containing protein n=1 Tax=Rothia kristinae TaxID=37923 RepID=A0A7T4T4D8_9MICC|nr:DUF6318 family protein [Rothia kristinae]QQC59567.1 hypothetical protein I6H58_00790 [Rothia kristinae]
MARSHRPASPLAPLVLAGALLLSGCGGESSGEVVGTADPRASAGASVSADSAASSSASSTGYEKATPEHPARNVPVPTLPEAATEETDAGARAFLQYWAESLNYLLQTGDPQHVREAMSDDNDQFTKVMENYERYYREGKWSVGTEQQIDIKAQDLTRNPDGEWMINVSLNRTSGKIYSHSGVDEEIAGQDFNNQPLEAYLVRDQGAWKLLGFGGIQDVDYGL